jgi:hypothetical protein
MSYELLTPSLFTTVGPILSNNETVASPLDKSNLVVSSTVGGAGRGRGCFLGSSLPSRFDAILAEAGIMSPVKWIAISAVIIVTSKVLRAYGMSKPLRSIKRQHCSGHQFITELT